MLSSSKLMSVDRGPPAAARVAGIPLCARFAYVIMHDMLNDIPSGVHFTACFLDCCREFTGEQKDMVSY